MTLDLAFLPNTDDEPHHASSPTADLLNELQLYGYRPHRDEPDPRPLPEADRAMAEIGACFETLTALFADTRLEDDLADLLWSFVNLFQRKIAATERKLDNNEQAQRRSQQEQDGSEVRSVELERLVAEGVSLIERRHAFEAFRDFAAEHFEAITGTAWRPRTGSIVNRKALTAAMIDSRDFIAARRQADAQVMLPTGPKIAFTGGIECNDHARIWDALDKVHVKHPLILRRGTGDLDLENPGSRSCEKIVADLAAKTRSSRLT